MRAVVQRVASASVAIEGGPTRAIGRGLLVFLGIGADDQADDGHWVAAKIVRLRIFPDDNGQMNRSVMDVAGQILLVSQFTLHASTAKGTRPSFNGAARPEVAKPLYELFINQLRSAVGGGIQTGEFGAMMEVSLVNSGPVTILLDSKQRE